MFNKLIEKFPISSYNLEKINTFFEEKKINYIKNMKSYVVYDFDLVLNLFCEILEEIKDQVEEYISVIFRALNVQIELNLDRKN